MTDEKILEKQYDYAWKWFSFHADQRTKMFNFMLLVFGILSAAIATTIDKKLYWEGIAICVAGFLFALIFSRLDRRNGDLVRLGEDVLVEIERKYLFGEDQFIKDRNGRVVPFGVLWRQKREEPSFSHDFLGAAGLGKHRIWLRGLAYIVAFFFFSAAMFIWLKYVRP